jgi:hypothetical protein
MNGGRPVTGRMGLGGAWARPPRDLVILLAVLFLTYALQFFESTAVVPALLRLWPLSASLVPWQLVTYPFVGTGGGLGFLIELAVLYMFGCDAFYGLGRKHFWRLLLLAAIVAGAVALLVQVLVAPRMPTWPSDFPLLQGQRVLLSILVAAYATAYGSNTIYLMFVLPIQARHFLWIEIAFAFVGFLPSHDLAGFCGICAAVATAYLYVRSSGRLGRGLRHAWKRIEYWWLAGRLERMRRRRGLRVVRGSGGGAGGGGGPRGPGERGPLIH